MTIVAARPKIQNEKAPLVIGCFNFQYLGANECEMGGKPTPTPADVIVLFISVVAR